MIVCNNTESSMMENNASTADKTGTIEGLVRSGMILKATANKDTLSLAPATGFQDAQKQSLAAVTVLDVATTAIIVQADFQNLDGVKDLKTHQTASKADANTWRTDVRPTLFSVNDAIINFNTEFTSLYDPLYKFAGQLADPAQFADAQANLVAGLQALQEVLKKQKGKVTNATAKINTLRQSMLEHEAALNGDLTEISAKYAGDQGMIADLTKQIAAYDKAMNTDLTFIGIGAGAIVVGGLTVAVGVALWLESAGGSTPVIAVGVGIIAAGGGAVGYSVYDYNKSSNNKSTALATLATLNAEIAVATALQSGVSTLRSHLDTASNALGKLSGAWDQLDRDYQNVIDALTNTQTSAEKAKALAFIVQANLSASKQQWDILVADANTVKQNLLAPMKVDTTALDKSDGKNPARPDVPVGPAKKLLAVQLMGTAAAPQPPAVEVPNSGYRLWVGNMVKAVSSFQYDMNSLSTKSTTPANVVAANNNLGAVANPAISATNDFISATEELSRQAAMLRTTAALGDDTIVTAAAKVFEEVAAILVTARDKGVTAGFSVAQLENAVDGVDAALSGWLSDMKSSQAFAQSKLDDVTRLRDCAQRDMDKIKNDYWYCFLGPIACAVVAIEASVRISNAQSDIKAYNAQVSALDQSLSDLLSATNDIASLSGHSVALSKSIDGGLAALQVVKSTVDGINATLHALTPFIVRAHLNAVADQIDGVATVRLTHSARMLFRVMSDIPDTGLVDTLQKLAASALMIQNSAMLTARQPKLVSVENLLKQDQSLLSGHVLEWLMTYSNNVLSEFSALRAVGDSIQYLGKGVLDQAVKGDIASAAAGVDAIIDSFAPLIKHRLLHDTLCLTLFNENIKNDQSSFNTVADVLRNQLEGSAGELATLEAKESAYTLAIEQSLSDIVDNSTRVITEHLAWGVVLAVSIGLGQIEFTAAATPTMMFLVKKGASLALKSASDATAAMAKKELTTLERKGDDIDTQISERKANLEKISALTADMAILRVLSNDVSVMKENSAAALKKLDEIKSSLQSEIQNFYTIKYALKSSEPSKGIDQLKSTLQVWENIGTAAGLLENTVMASFTT